MGYENFIYFDFQSELELAQSIRDEIKDNNPIELTLEPTDVNRALTGIASGIDEASGFWNGCNTIICVMKYSALINVRFNGNSVPIVDTVVYSDSCFRLYGR